MIDEVLERYTTALKTLDSDALNAELAGLILVQPKFAPHLQCVVRELESRAVNTLETQTPRKQGELP